VWLEYIKAHPDDGDGLTNLNPDGLVLNNVAYQMAGADLELPLALQFAEKAVRQTEEESQKITLPALNPQDLAHIFPLSAYWDTLGWVNERMSNFGPAEQYLLASWKLTPGWSRGRAFVPSVPAHAPDRRRDSDVPPRHRPHSPVVDSAAKRI
jgi:hypothetical protein